MNLKTYVNKYRKLFKERNPNVQTAHTKDGHFYVSGEEKYHSVTYFTSFIKDPSLSNWRMNRALDYVMDSFMKFGPYTIADVDMEKIVLDAKSAPEGQFLIAGDIGTQTHAWRQFWFSAWIRENWMQLPDKQIDSWSLPENADPEVISGCRAIKSFLKETGYIPVACELALVDDELKVGGTIDDIGVFPNTYKDFIATENNDPLAGGYRLRDKPYFGFVDLKTSNQGKKPSYAFQVRGFYQRMIRKTFGVKPKKTYILHTSKEDGTYKLIDLTDMKFLEKDAKYLVNLSRSWDKAVDAFKPKVITI